MKKCSQSETSLTYLCALARIKEWGGFHKLLTRCERWGIPISRIVIRLHLLQVLLVHSSVCARLLGERN